MIGIQKERQLSLSPSSFFFSSLPPLAPLFLPLSLFLSSRKSAIEKGQSA